MSLNWNIEACNMTDDFKKEHWNTIESMIFLTMVIDVGEIKQSNLHEVENRIRLYSRVTQNNFDDILAILPAFVGLKTNVTTTTAKHYEKRILVMLKQEIDREFYYKEQKEKHDKAGIA